MAGEPPAWRGRRRVLLRGGNVYSPADPFATAMLVAGHEVAWIGGDGAALAVADGVDEVIDLHGALVAPVFVDAHVALSEGTDIAALRSRAAARGVGVLHLVGADGDALRQSVELASQATGPLVVAYWRGRDPEQARGYGAIGFAVDVGEPAGGALAAAAEAGTQAMLLGGASAVAGMGPGAAAGHRLEVAGALTAQEIAAVAGSGIVACVHPGGGPGLAEVPLGEMAAAGIPLAIGSALPSAVPDPWDAVAAAVHHPDPRQRISARAAFAAHTRGGWRAAGAPGAGVLLPGAPAHYVIWEVDDLVVQAPDDRIQAWSTDPRSGTPGLPDLSPGTRRPRCWTTVVWGSAVA